MRILSLLPSSTEVLCALELEEFIVGRSHDADYPASVQNIPVVTQPRTQNSGKQGNNSTESMLADILSIHEVDLAAIHQLSPDLIITQISAWNYNLGPSELRRMLEQWLSKRIGLMTLNPHTLNDAFNDMKALAKVVGDATRGEDLVRNLQRRMVIIAQRAKMLDYKPGVAVIDWFTPPMLAGNWIPTLIEMTGGVPIFGTPGTPSEPIEWANLLQADPDVILLAPLDYTIDYIKRHVHTLTRHPEWESLRAVQQGNVYIADGRDYFNRPGPRLVESLEILAEILHPEAFSYGHSGGLWQRL